MLLHKKLIHLSILALMSPVAFAQETENVHQLEVIRVKAHPLAQTAADFAAADHIVEKKRTHYTRCHHWRCIRK